jgi:antitoxin (DNA-binding transcriptional repressor) of toxin-antitoxin stability system
MKQVPVSKFKTNCSSFIKKVHKTKRSIQITRRGKIIAEIRPIPSRKSELGGGIKGIAE